MAFVIESERHLNEIIKVPTSGDIGPGHYHNEGMIHRMAMDSIYPKKKVPFNSNTERFDSQLSKTKKSSPGKL
jgi:hypothetical protein